MEPDFLWRPAVTRSEKGSPPRFEGSEDSITCLQSIDPVFPVISSSVCIHGVTQVGLRSHPAGLFAPETTTMTFQLHGSDQPVCSTSQVRPVSPSAIFVAVAGPLVPHHWNPNRPFHTDATIILYGCFYQGGGAPL